MPNQVLIFAVVFGMAPDLSGFLTVLGGTIDGDGLQWSIGGPNAAVPGYPPLFGRPQGISGSHNKYEGDASPGRGDLYLDGDDFTLQPQQFQRLHDLGKANGDDIDLDLMNTFRSERFDHSVQKNPYFFNGPFTGVLVQPAAYEFIYRFMSNKSKEYPAGKLNTEVLRSFFGVTQAKNGKLTVVPGNEKIPDNWYKRAIGDEYSIPFLNSDTTLAATRFPKFLNIGGNMGKGNTFTGVSVNDLTGGALNSGAGGTGAAGGEAGTFGPGAEGRSAARKSWVNRSSCLVSVLGEVMAGCEPDAGAGGALADAPSSFRYLCRRGAK